LKRKKARIVESMAIGLKVLEEIRTRVHRVSGQVLATALH
jgi:hypothetical protein